MRLRPIGLIVALGILGAPLAAGAQKGQQVPRVGFLANIRSPATAGFEQGLRELGYEDGKNIIIEWRLAQGHFDRLPELAADLVRLKVDVIVAPADPYVRVARQATTTIPIVFALVADPVTSGFVASLAKPGGNVTGFSSISGELNAKRLQLLKEAVPGVARVAVLARWGPVAPSLLRDAEVVARVLSVQLQVQRVQEAKELESAFWAMERERAEALLELPDVMFYAERTRIVKLAAQHRLPAMFSTREFVEAGGLMSYSANYADLLRRSASYVHKILKGAKPADLPVEQPTKFELVINLKTAKALGLTIPQSVLIRSDEVIQ